MSEHALECHYCFNRSVYRQDDGSYICRLCHAVAEMRETVVEQDQDKDLPDSFQRTFHISQKPTDDEGRKNIVALTEAMQLILACETVAAEKLFGMPLSDAVFKYLVKFFTLIQPPLTKNSFSTLPLILLSGLLHIGLPVTHLDIIRWIRDGLIPFNNPNSYLPISFTQRLSTAELKILKPDVINLQILLTNNKRQPIHKLHPLPNIHLVFWRIAASLEIPERPFVSFCIALGNTKPLSCLNIMQKLFNQDRAVLHPISSILRKGYALPIALSLYALSLIYRLDGTDWIHPAFAKAGFPSYRDIISGPFLKNEVAPAFPYFEGRLQPLYADLITLLNTEESIPIEVNCIINDVHKGFGDETFALFEVNTLSDLNPDLLALMTYLSRCFGISPLIIMKQLSIISKVRFGRYMRSHSENKPQTSFEEELV